MLIREVKMKNRILILIAIILSLVLITNGCKSFMDSLKKRSNKSSNSKISYSEYIDGMTGYFEWRLNNDGSFISNKEIDESATELVKKYPSYHSKFSEEISIGSIVYSLGKDQQGKDIMNSFIKWYKRITQK